ncbi:MAG: (d)CMP kinase [Candidatus Micrarchaeota archaeon]
MIITVWGWTGAGKNTLGELLAKRLGYRTVSPTFKDLAAKEGISLLEFQKKAEKDPDIDRKFDELLKEEAGKGNCIVTTWLGPWMVPADFRILVFAPEKVRIERIAKRESVSQKEAAKYVREKDSGNIKRYKNVYGIDITDTSSFDLALSAETYRPEQMVEIALLAIEKKMKK